MKISKKYIFLNFFIVFSLMLLLSLIFLTINFSFEKNSIINELKNINNIFVSTVDIFVNESIENHLKTKVEIDRVFINNILNIYKKNQINESTARKLIKDYLKNVKIGDTGYVFIWNIKNAPQKVILDLHPEIEGKDVANVDFVQTGVSLKQGYMEYLWANPSDPAPRYKSMYLEYIKELDWIIAYSSYKEEFYKLVNIEKLNSLILEIKSFGFGNSYIIDYNGNIFIHKFEKGNFYNARDKKGKEFIKEIIDKKEGLITYYWYDYTKNKTNQYKKIACYSNIDKFKLIIISSVFIKDAFSYYTKILTYAITFLILFLLISFFLTIFLTNKVLAPFYILQENVNNIISNNEYLKDRIIDIYDERENLNLKKRKKKIKKINFDENDEIITFSSFFDKIIKNLNKINLELKIEYEREKKLKEDYERQKNFNDEILNLLTSSIVIVDINGKIINLNKNFLSNFLPYYNYLDRSTLSYLDDLDILQLLKKSFENQIVFVNDLLLKTIEEKKVFEKKIEILINEEKKIFLFSSIPYLQNNEIKYIIFKFDNITSELEKLNQEAEIQKYDAFNLLIKGLSHDINNYTAAIIGSSNLLNLDLKEDIEKIEKSIEELNEIKDKEKYNNTLNNNYESLEKALKFFHYLKKRISESYLIDINAINNSGKKVSGLISKLNIFSRKVEKEFNKIDIFEILNKVISISKSSFGKEVNIEFIYEDKENYYINGIEDQIESMLLNMFINSYHAMTILRNSPNKNNLNLLKIKLEKSKIDNVEYVKISIIDNGIGIEDNIKSKIFDPFFTTKPKEKGSGLGLYITSNIVRNHNGKIKFDSKVGEGTSFYIYLPVFKEDDNITEIQKEDNIKTEKLKESIEIIENKKDGTRKKRILVIDDEENLRLLLKKGLEKNGFSVKLAENGISGIELYSNFKDFIDIVILDLIMPGINGKDTLVKLKEINPELNVIMISGYIDDEKISECYNLGVKDFLQKPFDINDLINKINNI